MRRLEEVGLRIADPLRGILLQTPRRINELKKRCGRVRSEGVTLGEGGEMTYVMWCGNPSRLQYLLSPCSAQRGGGGDGGGGGQDPCEQQGITINSKALIILLYPMRVSKGKEAWKKVECATFTCSGVRV